MAEFDDEFTLVVPTAIDKLTKERGYDRLKLEGTWRVAQPVTRGVKPKKAKAKKKGTKRVEPTSFVTKPLSLNCEIRFIRDLPIKLPKPAEGKKLAERFVGSVRAIMDAKAALRQPAQGKAKVGLSDREKNQHEAAIKAHEHRINQAVFALYGVKGLPGAEIAPAVSPSLLL